MDVVDLCDCVPEEDVCLFCWFPDTPGYSLEKYHSGPHICPKCFKEDSRDPSFHLRCSTVIEQCYPRSPRDGRLSLDELFECVISARPLINICRDTTTFLPLNFPGFFSTASLERPIELLPELIKKICHYLDPFPELIALRYAVSVAVRYEKRRGPHWTIATPLRPGLTLYLTYDGFDGRNYLTALDHKPLRGSTKVVHVHEDIIVCRDHFGIVDVVSASDVVHVSHARQRSDFYQRISIKQYTGLRGFSDGIFLKGLVGITDGAPSFPIVEWSIPYLPPFPDPVEMYWLWTWKSRNISSFNRYRYHNLDNILGIYGVVRHRVTIGLFCHREPSGTSFRTFAAQLERTYSGKSLIFLYFPIAKDEKVCSMSVRSLPGSHFPTNMPIIQMATSKQRTYSFGPQPQDEGIFDYQTMRPSPDGSICGVFHSSNTVNGYPLREIGISVSGNYETLRGVNISPGFSIPCPSLGSPNADWFLSKVRLEPDMTFRICKADVTENECQGILATYSDDRREALGQVRFDQHLSQHVNIEDCCFSNQAAGGRLRVVVRTSLECLQDRGCDTWHLFPTTGTLVWWFGLIGNQVSILDDGSTSVKEVMTMKLGV